ncbi:MAG: T9SS type A sorting domain-containing protein [Chloroherpetonaceae bacterium]|nr:T9SS type A sorting domain-containing protein [Chloroherpetonaceae bacterium]
MNKRIIFLLMLFLASSARAQTVNENLWVTDGTVYAVVTVGNTAYIGGSFTQVGPATGSGVALDATSGVRDAAFPKVLGNIRAVVPDGSGGWIIGGDFTAVGGVPRNYLARIRADKTLDPNWNPNVDGTVGALAVSGGVVYAGGWFTTVNGSIARNYLAAFDLTTGTATSWNPDVNGEVYALAVSGGTLYAGGDFTTVNGSVSRNGLAAFDLTTGTATAWNPDVFGYVYALAVSGGTLYAGGGIATVNGSVLRNGLAAFDLTTGTATAWNPNVNGTVRALAVSGGVAYAGGFFTGVSNLAQASFAGISAFTFPDYAGPTSGIASGSYNNVTFTASGNLPSNVTVNGTLTLNSGVVSNLNGHTITVTNDASNAVAGTGFLTGSGSLARFFNGNQAYAFPYSQAGNDRTATVQFTSGAGTGTLTYQFFNTPPGNAGLPQTILGQTISVVAPFYWRIDATGAPGDYTLSLRGQNAGGISNVSALRIVKRANGGSWSATGAGTGTANTGTAADPTVVQSGITGFSEFTIGSDPASNPLPVELSAFTGEAVREGVRLVWTTASELNNAGFEVQRRMENVGAGIENDWQVLGFVKGKGTTSEAQSYSFLDRTASGKMQYRLKQVDFDGQFEILPTIEVEAGIPRTFELSQNYPNPFNPTTVIGYQLPVASEVRLKIYDMLGREVATLVNERQEAGRYQAQFNASGLASGVYFYRLQAGSFAETKKMMLVK